MTKIPPQATQVFKGKIFEVWQWEQKLFDGTTDTFEMLRRPNTANVIAVVGENILVCEQRQPDRQQAYLSLPGGRCDWNEDPLAAAKRELLEETGYASDDWEIFQEHSPEAKLDWTILTYVARNCRKAQEPHLDAGEEITARLLTFDEFLAMSDDPRYHEGEMITTLLRARLNPAMQSELRGKLFPISK